jgi:hypothetical protein
MSVRGAVLGGSSITHDHLNVAVQDLQQRKKLIERLSIVRLINEPIELSRGKGNAYLVLVHSAERNLPESSDGPVMSPQRSSLDPHVSQERRLLPPREELIGEIQKAEELLGRLEAEQGQARTRLAALRVELESQGQAEPPIPVRLLARPNGTRSSPSAREAACGSRFQSSASLLSERESTERLRCRAPPLRGA